MHIYIGGDGWGLTLGRLTHLQETKRAYGIAWWWLGDISDEYWTWVIYRGR